jgi:hypothetical protein
MTRDITMTRTLWRLSGAAPTMMTQPQRLVEGLRLHLAQAALLTVLVQIGEQQRAYLALTGCPGCSRGQCQPGCSVDRLRQLLQTCFATVALHPVASGLAHRPYHHAVVAVPCWNAQPPDGSMLLPWPEARLQIQWLPGRTRTLRAALVFAVGGDGPDPASILKTRGWQPLWFRSLLAPRAAITSFPTLRSVGRHTRLDPSLLLPGSTSTPAPEPRSAGSATRAVGLPLLRLDENGQDATNGHRLSEERASAVVASDLDDAMLEHWLRTVLQGSSQLAPAPQASSALTDASDTTDMADLVCPWPAGPGGIHPHTVGDLLSQIVRHPACTTGNQVSQIGLVRGRLVKVLGLSDALAAALMVWFDAAGILSEPFRAEDRWRKPRPLQTSDLAVIARRLHDTPLPTDDTIRRAYGGVA